MTGRIARILLVAVILTVIILAGIWLVGRADERTVSALFGTGIGLSEGQVVEITGGGLAGRIRSIEPVSEGVVVTIALDGTLSLNEGTIVLLRPGTPPVPSRLEILLPDGGAKPISYPARLQGRIEVGPPDGLAEPSPVWPGAAS